MLPRHGILLSLLALILGVFAPSANAAQSSIDMTGKTALVTGSTSGLGEVVARRLGALGATVLVHGLDEQRGAVIAAEISRKGPGRALFYRGDLGSLTEVRQLAARVRAAHPRLHLLINNAGIYGAADQPRRLSADGYEQIFAINYLAHFLLTRELLPLLEAGAPARIVNVASIGQRPVNFDDVMMERNFSTNAAYSQSKLAQILFTISLAEQLDARNVIVNAVHPASLMNTPMVAGMGRPPLSSVEDGADAVMQLAVGTAIAGRSGLYFDQLKEARANAQAYDATARQRLWELSLQLTANRKR
jgi:NAD(P)-dependent dehydrogenase (short-subunit alcohol dehydrogenase family)